MAGSTESRQWEVPGEELEQTTFGDVAIGEDFYFSAYGSSGLLADLGRPGRTLYRRMTTHTYRREDNGTTNTVGSLSAVAWVAR